MPPQRNVKKSSNKLINTKKSRIINLTILLHLLILLEIAKIIFLVFHIGLQLFMAKVNNTAFWIIALIFIS